MKMQEIRELAKTKGIKSSRLSKMNLVREIQRLEGNFDCFGTDYQGVCDQAGCLWREDCFNEAKKALAS
jgi:hypothetical protein